MRRGSAAAAWMYLKCTSGSVPQSFDLSLTGGRKCKCRVLEYPIVEKQLQQCKPCWKRYVGDLVPSWCSKLHRGSRRFLAMTSHPVIQGSLDLVLPLFSTYNSYQSAKKCTVHWRIVPMDLSSTYTAVYARTEHQYIQKLNGIQSLLLTDVLNHSVKFISLNALGNIALHPSHVLCIVNIMNKSICSCCPQNTPNTIITWARLFIVCIRHMLSTPSSWTRRGHIFTDVFHTMLDYMQGKNT